MTIIQWFLFLIHTVFIVQIIFLPCWNKIEGWNNNSIDIELKEAF
jgi:hypothetical protein